MTWKVSASPAGDERLQGRERFREPRFVPAQLCCPDPDVSRDVDADGEHARGDQREPADALGVAGRVQHGQIRAGGVTEQVQPVEPQVLTQRFHVVDEPVAPVGGRIVRRRRPAGAPQIQHDQAPVRGQPAEVPEIDGVLHRPAGQTDQRRAVPEHSIGQLGAVVRGEGRHGHDSRSGVPAGQPGFAVAPGDRGAATESSGPTADGPLLANGFDTTVPLDHVIC